MKQVAFGNTEIEVSQIYLGAMLMGTAINQEDSFTILDHFMGARGNFIDTANCYAGWMGHQYNGDESETIGPVMLLFTSNTHICERNPAWKLAIRMQNC